MPRSSRLVRGRPRTVVALAALALTACALHRPSAPPLRVGTSGDYAPFSSTRDGRLDGLDVDVARRFARDLGRPLELVPFRWPSLTEDLRAGRFELAMGGITVRPERALAGTFTRPVAVTRAVLLGLGPAVPSVSQLDRPERRVAVNAGGHLERVARRLLPHATVVTADNAALPQLLRSGEADAIVTDDAEAVGLAAVLPGAVRSPPLTRDRKAYLGRDPALVAQLDAWLRAREADGTLAALRRRWLPSDEDGSGEDGARSAFESDLDALLALVDLRLAFMPLVAAAKAAAGRPVHDAAQEERVLAAVAEQAAGAGLGPASATAFFAAQLAAARAVQQRSLATPPSEQPLEPPDLGVLRSALQGISSMIVARAADVAAAPEALAASSAPRLAERLDAAMTDGPSRLAIAEALRGLRRSPRS